MEDSRSTLQVARRSYIYGFSVEMIANYRFADDGLKLSGPRSFLTVQPISRCRNVDLALTRVPLPNLSRLMSQPSASFVCYAMLHINK